MWAPFKKTGWIRKARAIVPLDWRRHLALQRRHLTDRTEGIVLAELTARQQDTASWVCLIEIKQPIKSAPFVSEKTFNLAKACALFEGLQILPGQTLSFWHVVGPPTARKGWQSGRTIINDVMTTDPGGGLCQLSSLLYHLGLSIGLCVVERHAHSQDIHDTDETRFTPLGLDATVVFGFKDLRLRNNGVVPVALGFTLTGDELSGHAIAPRAITLPVLRLEREDSAGHRTTRLFRHWPEVRRNDELGAPEGFVADAVVTTVYKRA